MSGNVIRYSYRNAPTIWRFSQSNAFIRGLMGPFRSGKSSGCCIEILRRAQMQAPGKDGIRRTRWMVVRNTSGELRDTTIKTFMMWAPEAIFGDFNQTNMDYVITGIDGCHIEILFRALDRPDHVAKLLSLELTGAYINEAREIPWAIVQGLEGRVMQYPSKEMGGCTWGGIIMDTNPPDTDSRWYKFFEVDNYPAAYREIFKQPSGLAEDAENIPHINGGRTYYERLAMGKDADYIKVYIHGQYGFTKYGKVVYDEYNDHIHCQEMDPIPGIPIHRGFDWGLTPAAIFSQFLPDQRWLVFDEYTSEDMSIETFFEEVADHSRQSFRKLPTFVDTGDPAGDARSPNDGRSAFQIGIAKGFDLVPGMQDPLVRIESVRRPLRRLVAGKPQFILHPRCKVLRKGFLGGYHYRKRTTVEDQYEPKPYKNQFSHPHDALQYTATRIFGSLVLSGLDPQHHVRFEEQMDESSRSRVTGY